MVLVARRACFLKACESVGHVMTDMVIKNDEVATGVADMAVMPNCSVR